jgi:hypothetical protein
MDPGNRGKWIEQDVIFQANDGTLYFIDEKILTEAREAGDELSIMAPSDWRCNGHPALGRKAEHFLVTKVSAGKGRASVAVTAQKDVETILAWRKRKKDRAAVARTPKGWQTRNELCTRYGIKDANRASDNSISFSIVLRIFRDECPESASQVETWVAKRNCSFSQWHFDPAAFDRWLNGRSYVELAKDHRRAKTPQVLAREQKRLDYAVRFLQYVLTRGAYHPRLFRRFLRKPPIGRILEPFPEGLRIGGRKLDEANSIRAWAKSAGISIGCGRNLERAAGLLKVESFSRAFQGPHYWRLRSPITVEKLSTDQDIVSPPSGNQGTSFLLLNGIRSGRKRRNKRPAEAVHREWKSLRDRGLSHGQIAKLHTSEKGEPTSADTVRKALSRL